jgi:hypothetical protein
MPYLKKRYDFQRTILRVISGIEVGKEVLPRDELLEVLSSPNRDELFIGGVMAMEDAELTLYRGNLEPIVVPCYWFKPSGDGVRPEYSAFTIADFGHTVKLGEYEAATHAVLFDFDGKYRHQALAGAYAESQRKAEAFRKLRRKWRKAGV